MHLIKSLKDDLKCIRESWNVILEESKLVASTLGLSQHFQEKRRRISRTFHDKNQAKKYEGQNEETLFRINVFNVTLDTVISQVIHRFETTKQVNNMFYFGIRLAQQKMQKTLTKPIAEIFQNFIQMI